MTNFVIRTDNGEDLGFLLFVECHGGWPPSGLNECVFTGFPRDPRLLDDPCWRFVMEHKEQEWIATVNYTDTEITALIDLGTGWTFELRSSEDGYNWTAQRKEEVLRGRGMFL
ncbi:hypothetical protein ACRYWZ_14390 [Agrobacterium deltaense]|uniref:hypothetical protein n=1 Tax=Agrobacterium deltaense TaxID=1183412 RepID=UPI003D95D388